MTSNLQLALSLSLFSLKYYIFSFHISGATVVSWRVNNQEQLFVR